MKTSELIGPALIWAVAKCEGVFVAGGSPSNEPLHLLQIGYTPSSDWAQGGPIIEREEINIYCHESLWWEAEGWFSDGEETRRYHAKGPTPLIAAMRCYCCAKLGDEVDIPQELQPCPPPNL